MTEQVVTEIVIDGRGATAGAAEVTAAFDKIAAKNEKTISVMTTGAGSFDAVSKSWLKAQGMIDPIYRAQAKGQQDIERYTKAADDAVRLGIATKAQAAAGLGALKTATDKAVFAQTGLGKATSGLSAQLVALSAGAGPAGTLLAAFGPAGLAAAIGIGAAVSAFTAMSGAAHDLAQKSIELSRFSEITGLTTNQVQALRSEASKFGVTSEEAQTAIQNFSARFNELRTGQGELLTQIRRVNPALADQMAAVTDTGTALTLFGKALSDVDNVFQRNALVKAAAGKGGLATAAFLSSLDVSKVTQSYVDAGKALDENLIKKLTQLEISIAKSSSKARENISSIFAQDVLEKQDQFYKGLEKITRYMRDNPPPQGWLSFFGGMIPFVGPMIGAGGAATALVKRVAQDPVESRIQSMVGVPEYPEGVPKELQPPTKKDPLFDLNTLKAQVAALGEAARASDRLKIALGDLKLAGTAAGLSAEQLTRAEGILNEAFRNQQIQQAVSALGSAATVTEQYEARVAALNLQLAKGDITQTTFNRAVSGLRVDQQLQSMRDTISALGDGATASQQYELRVAELSQMLKQGRISQETFNQSVRNLQPAWQAVRTGSESFFSSFAQSIAQGKTGIESLIAGANSLAGTLTNIGSKNFSQGFTQMLQGGGMGGFDPVSLGIGAAGMLLGSLLNSGQEEKKRQQEIEAAKQAWANMEQEWKNWLGTLTGSPIGSLGQSLQDAFKQLNDYIDAIAKAHGSKSSAQTEQIPEVQQSRAAFNQGTSYLIEQFKAQWLGMIAALQSGLGSSSPFVTAADNVSKLATEVEGFITDTQKAFEGYPEQTARVNEARAAAQTMLLSLLDTPPALTDIQKRMLELQGTAVALQKALEQTGMGAEAAAAVIQGRLNAAIAGLTKQFFADLQSKINEAEGNTNLNSVTSLITEIGQLYANAAALGVNAAAKIEEYWQAALASIIESAPAVAAAKTALQRAYDAQAQGISKVVTSLGQAIKDIQAYRDGLKVNTQLSTLSPVDQLAAAKQQLEDAAKAAHGGDVDSFGRLVGLSQTYETLAQKMYGSTVAYAAIVNNVDALLASAQGQAQEQIDVSTQQLNALNSIAGATLGIESGVLSLEQAFANYTNAYNTAQQAAEQQRRETVIEDWVEKFKSVLNNQGREAYRAYLAQAISTVAGNPLQQEIVSRVIAALGLQQGGMVPGYAGGGVIANGVPGVDSVYARYAGGGHIMLAGREGVLTASATAGIGGEQTINYINRYQSLPGANDNGQYFAEAARTMARAIGAAAAAQIAALQDENELLRAEVKKAGEAKATQRGQRGQRVASVRA